MAETIAGRSTRAIAELLSADGIAVTHSAVAGFQRRHKDEIAILEDAVRREISELAVTEKAERIRRLSALYDGMQAIVDKQGLLIEDVKWIGDAETGREVKVVRFNAGLVQQMRGVLRDIADELGDIPRPAINIQTNVSQEVKVVVERRDDWRSSD